MSQPYRDDQDALESRLTALEQELEAVRARKRELDDVVQAEARLDKEADALRKRITHMRARRALPLLDSLRVASPCKADWNAMTGDDRVRFCASCHKDVYDLSGMTRDEAEAFVAEREGAGACIRLHKRRDGTVITSDCPVGASNARMRRIGAVALGASLMGAGAALFGATTTTMGDMDLVGKLPTVAPVPPPADQVMMGAMVVQEGPAPRPRAQPDPQPSPEPQPPKATLAPRK